MKIKEIKLYGFKSFPGETKLALDAGITAFVGPNGSGKSNIFDALRWVFGEQSMKALRCERIEDLIYVSPDTKDDANFTEVAVTIDNEEYFPQFGGEFEIKRRFYRSGESEFFLNRVKCRLQDIQALFLNSGTLTYSFLELSEIEKIIHGDTKHMFDDVSGILKYQERREQTRRRLEVTEQDLLRLEDIIHEMQRSVRSLKRQVRQTRLYQELREEYKRLTLYMLKRDYTTASAELAEIQNKINEHETRRQAAAQSIKQLEREREELKHTMAEIETKKRDTLSTVVAIQTDITRLQDAVAEKEEHARQILLHNERTITSIKEKEELRTSREQRKAQCAEQREQLAKELQDAEHKIKGIEENLDTLNKDFFAAKGDYDTKVHELKALHDSQQQLREDITRMKFEKENKQTLLERMNEEYSSEKGEYDHRKRELASYEENVQKIVAKQEELSKMLEDECAGLEVLQKDRENHERDLRQRKDALIECKLMIDTLKKRLTERDCRAAYEPRFGERFRGVMRENLEVGEGCESAVDVCLGDILNYALVEGVGEDDFMNLSEGRYGFIDITHVPSETSISRIPETLQSLTEFVTFGSAQDMLKRFFATYFLVEGFNSAYDFSNKYPGCGFVTRDGLLVKDGIVVAERGEVGFFRISQAIEEQNKQYEALKNELLFLDGEKKRLEHEIEKKQQNIETTKESLFSTNVEKSEYSMKLDELKQQVDKLYTDYQHLARERSVFEEDINGLTQKIQEHEDRIRKNKALCASIESEQGALVNRQQELKKDLDASIARMHEEKIAHAALVERENSLRSTAEHLTDELQEIAREITNLKKSTAAQDIESIQQEIAGLGQELAAKEGEKKAIETRLPEKAMEELTEKINAIFDALAEKQKVHEELQNGIMQLKYDSFQLTHRKDDAVKKAQDDFKIDLFAYVFEEDVLDVEARLQEVKGKLEKLGDVNPLSLDLYEQEKQRLDEFLSQRDDIITAKRSLLGSIDELDTRARERFIGTFSEVKKEFNFVFSNFFEGGQADLVLSDPQNPLTSKVDIVVRMKGKRLKTINQLSGGERTLLAISLLLAFYLVKPAPFCILDEIDAPLDDANVVRFNKFLRDLSQRTQVVIITHNRATMEYTDYLYGLTMEKPGQSKIISARLADLEKIGALE